MTQTLERPAPVAPKASRPGLYLAIRLADFLAQNQEALIETYPGLGSQLERLLDSENWIQRTKRVPSADEQLAWNNVDRVYEFEPTPNPDSVAAEVYTFGVGVLGFRLTVAGQ